MDQYDLIRIEKMMGNDEAADGVIGNYTASVADDVSLAGLQAQKILNIKPRIHTGHDCESF